METFIAILHVFVALLLIALVLLQDSKSGSLGGAFGGGGSNSVFGATGATTLAQKLTRWIAVVFATTCISLTIFSAKSHKSVIDNTPITKSTTTPAPVSPALPTPETVPTPTENK